MPHVHVEKFRVRHYECDMYNEVNLANYLRYMQEAAFGASAAVGFPPERYEALRLQWLAYETDVEIYDLLRYGDSFEIKTWVHDFRRVRSLRQYELYREGELIARASTDWVLLDMEKLFPASITQEIIEAYAAGDEVQTAPPRTPLPPARIPEDHLFSVRRRVSWDEIDAARHVNNAVYLSYVEDCEVQALAHFGHTLPELRAQGIGLMPQRTQIEYKQAAVYEDELEISTWIAAVDESTYLRHFVIRRPADDKLLVRVRGLRQWTDLQTGQPAPIPPDFLAAFAGNSVIR